MSVNPPFKIKIISNERIWYSMKADSTEEIAGILAAGNEFSLPFVSYIHVRLNQTTGTSLYINGIKIDELGDYKNPADIQFFSDPSTITVKHYLPQR